MSFEDAFGKPGGRPEGFWRPWLGHYCSLTPADIGDLTPAQLSACLKFVER